MNLNLYGYAGRWLMIDCGISFADDTMPGIEVIMPDPGFIEERRDELVGIVVTHAHEDHIGAIQYLWPRFKTTVYATPFTANLLRQKLVETEARERRAHRRDPDVGQVLRRPVRARAHHAHAFDPRAQRGGGAHAGRHACCTPAIGSSIPTRWWDRRPTRRPCGGSATSGVLAMVCDSTNALRPGEAGSEAEVGALARGAGGPMPQPRRGRLLCQQCRALAIDRGRRGGARSAGGAGRPLALAHRAGGARDRLSRGMCRGF